MCVCTSEYVCSYVYKEFEVPQMREGMRYLSFCISLIRHKISYCIYLLANNIISFFL